ncbi:MAG: hypothetical protein M1814_002185 [Vezdaea aestivalis]|nr:MAG: hypothetical protein M1814_002185 [Vezdaea aestivalis]
MAQTNGEQPHSLFFAHLLQFPLIDDSVTGFKQNAYGQRSISLADQGYATFAQPLLQYLQRPISIVTPYVKQVDSVADQGLSKIEDRFPAVKTPTDEVKGSISGYVAYPFQLAGGYRDHVFKTWSEENKKNSGSVLTPFKAFLTTGIILTADGFSLIATQLGKGKEEAEKKVKEKTDN